MIYFNLRSKSYGVETVDELDPKDFKTKEEAEKEVERLLEEYRKSGMPVYRSSRCTKEWKNR